MKVRIVTENNKDENNYKLLSVIDISDYDTVMKMFTYMKENDIPLEVNTNDIVDTDGEQYFVKDVWFVVPMLGAEIMEYISVFVK